MSISRAVQINNPDLVINYFVSIEAAARFAIADNGAIHPGCMIAMNAEKIIKLRQTPDLFSACQNICYYPDGTAALFFVKHKYPRIPGVELWLDVIDRAQNLGASICVFGASESVSQKTEVILSKRFPAAELTIRHGFHNPEEYDDIISTQKPGVVFVAMGSPRQEKLIGRLQKFSPGTLFLGIGGSLDVLTGEKIRAPAFFRKNNLEFAHRLLLEPSRIFRQIDLVKFLILYGLGKFN